MPPNEIACQRLYTEHRHASILLAREIERALANLPKQSNGDWSLVGDAARNHDQLKDLADRLYQRGEYAPDNRARF